MASFCCMCVCAWSGSEEAASLIYRWQFYVTLCFFALTNLFFVLTKFALVQAPQLATAGLSANTALCRSRRKWPQILRARWKMRCECGLLEEKSGGMWSRRRC